MAGKDEFITYVVDASSAQKGFQQVLAQSRPAAAELLNDVADWGRDHASELARVDRGALSEMIYVEYASHERLEADIISDQEYSATIETGSLPHWPPAHSLETWGKFHEYSGGSDDDFLLRRYISVHGTKAYPFMEPTAKKIPSAIEEFAKYYLDDLKSGGKYAKNQKGPGGKTGRASGIARSKSVLNMKYRKSMPARHGVKSARPHPTSRISRYRNVRHNLYSSMQPSQFRNPKTGKWESLRPSSIHSKSGTRKKSKPVGFTTKSELGYTNKSTKKGAFAIRKGKSGFATKAHLSNTTYRTKKRRKLE